jgi:thiol-disulfide isomerase/thioredoxin
MKKLICVLLLMAGCGESTELTAMKAAFETASETVTAKQDESLTILRENTTALAAIKSQVESLTAETREATDTLKASLTAPKPKGEEVIKSAIEPQEAAKANPSQSHQPVASPPAVRLQFFTQENCGPCKPQSRNAQAAADELGIRLEVFHWETDAEAFDQAGVDSTPRTIIVIDDKIRARLVGIVPASIIVARVNEELGKAMTGAPATGAIFPVQAANTVTSSRPSFRSVSFWKGHNRGPRITTRTTFRSGSSP